MSNTQQISQKMALLKDIGMIMSSLKTIAMLETQEAKATVSSQSEGLAVMSQALSQFLATHPDYAPPEGGDPTLLVVLGSERGFCGDFNGQLADTIESLKLQGKLNQCMLVSVGYRLTNKLEQTHEIQASLAGVGIYGEIETRLSELTKIISELSAGQASPRIALLYHSGLHKRICFEPLLTGLSQPLGNHNNPNSSATISYQRPLLNLRPQDFFAQALNEYILTRLNHVLTLAFFAENQIRVQHLESALDQIDEQSDALGKQLNHLRQEQITEELETILLNSGL